VRSRNVVVVVYRPDDPAASTAITDEDIIALLQGLYDALPA
jgi:hypothetical protein